MTIVIIIFTLWFILGIVGAKIDDDVFFNVPFLIFLIMIPFYPFIFSVCGL